MIKYLEAKLFAFLSRRRPPARAAIELATWDELEFTLDERVKLTNARYAAMCEIVRARDVPYPWTIGTNK